MGRTVAKLLLLIAVTVAPVEGLSWVASHYLVKSGLLIPPFETDGYSAYQDDRDPLLGWPSRTWLADDFDTSGSREVPAYPDPTTPNCVSIFGDSFTWGDEVSAEHSYGNVLAKKLGCRVGIFGVKGYGTDQALLRYRDRIEDHAPVVVLGHFSGNIIRNVNRFRGFLGGSGFGFKPRFVIDASGNLRLVPLPELTADEYVAIGDGRADLLPFDHFMLGGEAGTRMARFPYTLSAVLSVGHYRAQARLRGVPSFAPFYDEAHPSGGLAVTEAIIREFVAVAQARGQQPIVLMIPDTKDLQAMQGGGAPAFLALSVRLAEDGMRLPPLADTLAAEAGDGDLCDLYSRCDGGHFTPKGYRIVAETVAAFIDEGGWLRQ